MDNNFNKTAAQAYADYKKSEKLNRDQQMTFEQFKSDMKKEVEKTLQKSLKDFEKNLKKK